jgi:hypothetical protein
VAVCIAITRGGWGEAYAFGSHAEADTHPLIQFGDAIMVGPEGILRQYSLPELGRLLRMIGDEDLREAVLAPIHPDLALPERRRQERGAEQVDAIWAGLEALVQPVPTDAAAILDLVRRNRTLMIQEGHMAAEEKNKTTGTTTTAATTAAAAAPKAPKPPRYPLTNVITLLADKDGKKFGKDNNPKRAGSKAGDRFAKLVDGMTVEAFVKAVGNQAEAFADLDFGVKHGQLTVAAPKENF